MLQVSCRDPTYLEPSDPIGVTHREPRPSGTEARRYPRKDAGLQSSVSGPNQSRALLQRCFCRLRGTATLSVMR